MSRLGRQHYYVCSDGPAATKRPNHHPSFDQEKITHPSVIRAMGRRVKREAELDLSRRKRAAHVTIVGSLSRSSRKSVPPHQEAGQGKSRYMTMLMCHSAVQGGLESYNLERDDVVNIQTGSMIQMYGRFSPSGDQSLSRVFVERLYQRQNDSQASQALHTKTQKKYIMPSCVVSSKRPDMLLLGRCRNVLPPPCP